MLYNLQAAAFHLSFMLKEYTANDILVSFVFCEKKVLLNPIPGHSEHPGQL
jgi:hypothetical protein